MIPGAILRERPFSSTERGIPMAVGKVSDTDFVAEVLKATWPLVVDF